MSLTQTIAGCAVGPDFIFIERTARAHTRFVYPVITAQAAALGVHRVHLWQVLTGRRKSKSLLRRYQALRRGY